MYLVRDCKYLGIPARWPGPLIRDNFAQQFRMHTAPPLHAAGPCRKGQQNLRHLYTEFCVACYDSVFLSANKFQVPAYQPPRDLRHPREVQHFIFSCLFANVISFIYITSHSLHSIMPTVFSSVLSSPQSFPIGLQASSNLFIAV